MTDHEKKVSEATMKKNLAMWEEADRVYEAFLELGEDFENRDWGMSDGKASLCIAMARDFPPSERVPTLSWTHHKNVRTMPRDKRKALLDHISWQLSAEGIRVSSEELTQIRHDLEGKPKKHELTWETNRRKLAKAKELLKECLPHITWEPLKQEVKEWLNSK